MVPYCQNLMLVMATVTQPSGCHMPRMPHHKHPIPFWDGMLIVTAHPSLTHQSPSDPTQTVTLRPKPAQPHLVTTLSGYGYARKMLSFMHWYSPQDITYSVSSCCFPNSLSLEVQGLMHLSLWYTFKCHDDMVMLHMLSISDPPVTHTPGTQSRCARDAVTRPPTHPFGEPEHGGRGHSHTRYSASDPSPHAPAPQMVP